MSIPRVLIPDDILYIAGVVLLPKDDPWQAMFDALAEFPEDFTISREQPELQEREPMG